MSEYGLFTINVEDLLVDGRSSSNPTENEQQDQNRTEEMSSADFLCEYGVDLDTLFLPMEEGAQPDVDLDHVNVNTSEFVEISPEDVRKLIENEDNQNTKKKTLYDCSKFERFLVLKNESRQMTEIEPEILDEHLANFILSVRKPNGEEYEPSTIRSIISSIDRKLRRQKYPYRIISEPTNAFQLSRDAMQAKQKSLKRLGKGNKPKKSSPITDEEIDILYQKNILGRSCPKALLNTVWLNNCVLFGLRGTKENYDLR